MTILECFEVVVRLVKSGKVEQAAELADLAFEYAQGRRGPECVAKALSLGGSSTLGHLRTTGPAYASAYPEGFDEAMMRIDDECIDCDARWVEMTKRIQVRVYFDESSCWNQDQMQFVETAMAEFDIVDVVWF